MKRLTDIRLIIGVVVAIAMLVVGTLKADAYLDSRFDNLDEEFATVEAVEAAVLHLASVEDEVRKGAIRARIWWIEPRIDFLEDKHHKTGDDYYQDKREELKRERDCLERALGEKQKWPRDCRP
jgi:hypothetical protein